MKKPLFLTVRISVAETIESWIAGVGLGFLVLGIVSTVWFFRQTKDTFYQGLLVDGVPIGGLTRAEALQTLETHFVTNGDSATFPLTITVDDIAISSSSAELGVKKDFTQALADAFEVGRSGFPIHRLVTITQLGFKPQNFTSNYIAENSALTGFVQQLANQLDSVGQEPKAVLGTSGIASSLVVNKGAFGRQIDQPTTITDILTAVNQHQVTTPLIIPATVASTAAELSEAEVALAATRAEKFIGKQAVFSVEDITLTLNDQTLISLLSFPQQSSTAFDTLLTEWSSRINREAQEPVFEYNPQTLEVTTFEPPRNGLALNADQARSSLMTMLTEIEANAALSQTTNEITATNPNGTQPTVEPKTTFEYQLSVDSKAPNKSLADTNNLGITERIGFGDSEYDHSIPSRIHNVALTSSKITNHLVAPGEEFSFNQVLGEVSGRTGFQPAYVIRGGKTELGDGGGVCQVSTTLFRSVLNAGLEVTKRKQHSYRVSYYELNQKPGIDATVYSGDVDFRFKNDTDHHILIHSNANSDELYMTVELFGTSDGRQTEIVNHEVWDFRPAPPAVYTIDPSLPRGAVRQVDWAVSGVKTKFTNIIKDKDGAIIRQDEYYSNYVPWSAKYLRGA
jgi:vancomycin resistance protein YoaR